MAHPAAQHLKGTFFGRTSQSLHAPTCYPTVTTGLKGILELVPASPDFPFLEGRRTGDPGRARTYDLPLRRRLLYPAELRSQDAKRHQKPRGSPGGQARDEDVRRPRVHIGGDDVDVGSCRGSGLGLRDAADPDRPGRGSCRGTRPVGDRGCPRRVPQLRLLGRAGAGGTPRVGAA